MRSPLSAATATQYSTDIGEHIALVCVLMQLMALCAVQWNYLQDNAAQQLRVPLRQEPLPV
jgi:hypothetical protein